MGFAPKIVGIDEAEPPASQLPDLRRRAGVAQRRGAPEREGVAHQAQQPWPKQPRRQLRLRGRRGAPRRH